MVSQSCLDREVLNAIFEALERLLILLKHLYTVVVSLTKRKHGNFSTMIQRIRGTWNLLVFCLTSELYPG